MLEDLREGGRIEHDADRVVPAASTRKVAIMLTTFAAAAHGELNLEQTVVIDGRFRDEIFSGTLQHLTPGLTLTLRDAVTLMIILSDNLATAHVLELVGLDRVNELCRHAGLAATVHRHALIPRLPRDHELDATNTTTAADQAALYRAILAGTREESAAARIGCTRELCQLALEILSAQQHRDLIPALLPAGTVVAHKTGMGWRDVSDGGIVFAAGRPRFLLVAYTDQLPEEFGVPQAQSFIADIARICWNLLP
jgi:beta-lactamase class A